MTKAVAPWLKAFQVDRIERKAVRGSRAGPTARSPGTGTAASSAVASTSASAVIDPVTIMPWPSARDQRRLLMVGHQPAPVAPDVASADGGVEWLHALPTLSHGVDD